MTQHVYRFGADNTEGDGSMKELLGGKGAGLADMSRIGMPVPPGFTLTTQSCINYGAEGDFTDAMRTQVGDALEWLEGVMDARMGDVERPLLVSVRSGARVSMPGMMDTILNLGLNRETLEGLGRRSQNRRFALDCYRRLLQMYGDVVLGIKATHAELHDPFDAILEEEKAVEGVDIDSDLSEGALDRICARHEALILERTGKPFPQDPHEQLWGAIGAVFGSWDNDRAVQYRRIYRFSDDWGTAANVQAMCFGNLGSTSGTGVCFTRDPSTGANEFYGEYLMNAQGEDVVAGIRTPETIDRLRDQMPAAYEELLSLRTKLENHYCDMQDIEFTIQEGRLFLLQTRNGKRTGSAAVRIAADMVDEGLIDEKTAIARMDPEALNIFLQPAFEPTSRTAAEERGDHIGKGLPAGPGSATGVAVFSAEAAQHHVTRGSAVILIRPETSPEDIQGMHLSEGILTARGGMTSHAAVVGRQMGIVCVVGFTTLDIDLVKRQLRCGDRVVNEGEPISIDGFTGDVYACAIETRPSAVMEALLTDEKAAEGDTLHQMFTRIMGWADDARRLEVRANADTPEQARLAVALGAQGIGLCRTEHMFFEETRLVHMRRMILAETPAERREALDELLPHQRADFEGIFRAMQGRPVTIRTLDPPLHEFLPHNAEDQQILAEKFGLTPAAIAKSVERLHEFNPMLGHRGCRLGVVYPEITEMQVRAIIEAACTVISEGTPVLPEIMIPLVSTRAELDNQGKLARRVADEVIAARGVAVHYLVGTMIELPRACVRAHEIAEVAEFFSFGTNDLTQTTFGLSRDDSSRFLPHYIDAGLLPWDPFVSMDEGVQDLVRIAVEKGRSSQENLKLGICGEHGGDPSSIQFCHEVGLNYVSCSPYRIPIARLAAAQAAVRQSD
jgi:pyruvate,orthophosphate dikinase